MKNGYSLIELSICLALLGIIMGSGLAIGNMGSAKSQASITEAQLDEMEYAIQMFVNRHKRLPCPASLTVAENTATFGIEDVCANAAPASVGVVAVNAGSADELWIGAIPTRTLGLSDAKMFDAWNSRITYAVPKAFAKTTPPQIKLAVGNVAANLITIRNQNVQIYPQPLVPAVPFANPVAYVMVSHGSDSRGAYNGLGILKQACSGGGQLDVENCDNNVVFRQMDLRVSKIPNQYFHDFMRFKTRVQLGAAALN